MLNDIRYALRLLHHSPGYSSIVIVVLGLGIAVNLVAFSLLQALALSPIPGVDASSLHTVMARTTGGGLVPLSYPDFRTLRDDNASYTGLAGSTMQIYALGRGTEVRQIFGELVSGNYFDVLGVGAQLGRTLRPSDETAAGQNPVIVLAEAFWRKQFEADPGVIGRTILINGQPLTVVGVAARGFRGSVVGLSNDVFVPVTMQPQVSGCKCNLIESVEHQLLFGFGRPKPRLTLDSARADMALLSARLAAAQPVDTIDARASVLPLWESPYGAQTYMLPAVTLLTVMAALLLIVVCANIAGLVLARNLARRVEIAARLAVGASRGRVARQLFIESLVLAVPGAVLGTQLPRLAESFLRGPELNVTLPLYFGAAPAWTLFVAAAALSCLAAAIYGLMPGVTAARLDLAAVMKDGPSPHARGIGWLRTGLVMSQIAMAVVLLVGTALVVRSLAAARDADIGFDADGVSTATIDLNVVGYDDGRGQAFYRQLIEDIESTGATASLALYLPLMFVDTDNMHVAIDGYAAREDETLQFQFNNISPGYFKTIGATLAAGRDFDARDEGSVEVVIVNETMARRFFGSADAALGRRIRADYLHPERTDWKTIVGIARDMKYSRINEQPRPYFYVPLSQQYSAFVNVHARGGGMTPDELRRRIIAIDANVPVLRTAMLSEQLAMSVALFDFTARALTIIGVAAAGLAALGIYGLIAFTVRQRTHEIGVRMAIGADPASILRTFLGRGLRIGIAGVIAGAMLALAAARLMAALLYGVGAADAISFIAAAALVLTVCGVAALVPAWRASKTNPLVALRNH